VDFQLTHPFASTNESQEPNDEAVLDVIARVLEVHAGIAAIERFSQIFAGQPDVTFIGIQ
jgi:hypothetical protein